ncbi:hypothetical protein OEZ86_014709 [Tetradesmus obliquus]|nr:hypothetical protein OEZ86_014709 [Tetradesmus obliquus]
MLLIATASSSNVFAAQAGSTCRITTQNRAALTVLCHSSCHTCSRGPAGTPRAQRQCRCCKPGFFLAAGSTAAACTPCPAGQVGPLFGQTACRKCPRNLLSLKAGSRVCDGCSAGHGYVTVPVKLANGTTADLAACRRCLPGSIAPGGPLASTFCQACGQGRTTLPLPTPRTECAACRPGFGGKSCSPCKAGTYSRGGPADDVTGACIACPPGTTSSDGAAGFVLCRPINGSSPSPTPSPSPQPPSNPSPSPQPPASPGPSPSPSPSPQPSPAVNTSSPSPGPAGNNTDNTSPSPSPSPAPLNVLPNGTRFVANISVATNGLGNNDLAAALTDVVRNAVLNATAAAEDKAAVWVNTTIAANTVPLRRLQQFGGATYIIMASTTRDWQALQAATSSASLPPLLTTQLTRFQRSLVNYAITFTNVTAGTFLNFFPPPPSPTPFVPPPIWQPPTTFTCAQLGHKCSAGTLKPGATVSGTQSTDAICCNTCASFSCPAGLTRSPVLLLPGVAPSFRTCCDACGQFSCAPNAKRSPAPQINQAEASAELCCVLPPVERPQVELAVTASSCNAANNQLLAQETRNQLVQGLSAADAALIVVEVQSCGATNRRHLLQGVTIKMVITIRQSVTSEAAIQAATKVLIEAIGGPTVESLPPNATFADLLATLNNLVSNSSSADSTVVQELLASVNDAIVSANLTSVFDNATATAITVTTEPVSCRGQPTATGATFSGCSGEIDTNCTVGCDNGFGRVSSTCQANGTWSAVAGSCNTTPPTTQRPCSGRPSSSSSAVSFPDCTNLTTCTATCTGNTYANPAPAASCDLSTGNWLTPTGQCSPIECTSVPTLAISNANWAAVCTNISVGATELPSRLVSQAWLDFYTGEWAGGEWHGCSEPLLRSVVRRERNMRSRGVWG